MDPPVDVRRRVYEFLVAQATRHRALRRAGELLSPRQRRIRRTRRQLARDHLRGAGL